MNRNDDRDDRFGDARWSGTYQHLGTVTYVDLRPRIDQLTIAAERRAAAPQQKSANAITWPAV